ncbi:hypothetical protein ACJDU8_17350 [Clostridium sp. WILCCON 0269]|uniref:Transposase n=1 Tax=Candidatus Clostridium eludens TaxID=3381663 RepID=A0ABW8SPN0_9CLOT
MGQEVSNKDKCFEYFSKNDDKDKDEVISRAIKQFGITKSSAITYYYDWKKQYVSGDIKGINHNPQSGCKPKNEKPNLTDEMILEELKKNNFSYLAGTPEMIKCIANKFSLEEHTAKFRLKELADKRKAKEENEKLELTKITEDEIDELCENTEFEKGPAAVNEKPQPKKLLKVALLQGKVMSYEIQEGGFLLKQKSYINTIPVNFNDIDDFIAELKELKDVVM